MVANNNTMSQSTPTARQYYDLNAIAGAGESTRFVNEVTGILLGIEMRPGFYEIPDRRTGQKVKRPNSWIGHWLVREETGYEHEVLMSWPTYQDKETGLVHPWDYYDPSINLSQCAAQRIPLHMSRNERGFYKLEIVRVETSTMPIMPAAQHEQAAPLAPGYYEGYYA